MTTEDTIAPTTILSSPTSNHGDAQSSATAAVAEVASEGGQPFIEIISTPDRGLAAFTTRKVKAGTLIIAERPLITLDRDRENDVTAVEQAFSSLPSRAQQKTYLRLFDAQKSRMPRVASIYYSNCYNCEGSRAAGGSAIGATASRINHSCVPNVQFSFDENSGEMRFHALRDIPRGKEVCSDYDRAVFEVAARRRRKQMMYYGFACVCEACEPQTEFWARSDERRKGMLDAVRGVQACEKSFVEWESEDHDDGDRDVDKKGEHQGRSRRKNSDQEPAAVVDEAITALTRLEGLLIKESLVGVPLANAYRSLAKWAERKTDLAAARKWKAKELETCVIAFGKDGRRTKEVERKLVEME